MYVLAENLLAYENILRKFRYSFV